MTSPSSSKQVRTAVLLLNLGTPQAPTPRAVRRYLAEFLSDRRVIEIPQLIWQIILRLLILPFRARQSAAKYASVWLAEGSPLLVYTQAQTEALKKRLKVTDPQLLVEFAMRYDAPAISTVLAKLKAAGAERILFVPLYPQYSATTTASAFDAVFAALQKMREQPAIRTIKDYADFPPYIAALSAQVQSYWAAHGRPDFASGERLLLSFHGLPQRMVELGDPYQAQCQLTANLLAQALGLTEDECQLTFQSRFGPARWLTPYTEPTLKALGAAGVRRVDVFCPGFTADCLETLEEMGMQARETFLHAGGSEYHLIPCVNTAPAFIDCLVELIMLNLVGWGAVPLNTQSLQ